MVILTHVDESNRSRPIEEERRGVWNPYLDVLWILLQDAEFLDQPTLRIGQEENPIRETQFVDEDPSTLVDLCIGHHPDDSQIGCPIESFSQLHEPRLGVGSPVHAAFEGEQHAMTP